MVRAARRYRRHFEHGFKLGGEVRGITANRNPAVLVFLAKDYDFKRLAGSLVGGEGS